MNPSIESTEGGVNGERVRKANEEIERCAKAAKWLEEQAKDILIRKKKDEKLTDEDERRLRNTAWTKYGYECSIPSGDDSEFSTTTSDDDAEDVHQDPLQYWMAEVERMRKPGYERGYFSIVKRCFRTFTQQPFLFPTYQNDPRFLRICISYSKMCFSPSSVFHHMYTLGVGKKQALFWMEWGRNEGADMGSLMETGNVADKRGIGLDSGQDEKIPAVVAHSSKKRRRLNEAGEKRIEVEDDLSWGMRYKELDEYAKEHGNANVPRKYKRNLALSAWVKSQRAMFKQKILSQERINNLNKVGFVCILKPGWDMRYAELTAFANEHGNADVPYRLKQNPALGRWVDAQRTLFKRNKLPDERISRLRKVGFEFSKQKHLSWDARYAELVAYVREHGNTIIPPNYEQNTSLGAWVLSQRLKKKEKKLSQEQITCLQEIGFEFSLPEKVWDARYAELVVYVYVHGDPNVPRNYSQNPALGRWVNRQRFRFGRNKLSQEQIRRLRDLDFEFSVSAEQPGWGARYTELVAYVTENGNANIPQEYKENPVLGIWVGTQRTMFGRNKLSNKRIGLLRKIGFEFHERCYSQGFVKLDL